MIWYLPTYIYAFYVCFILTMGAKAAWPQMGAIPQLMLAPIAVLAVLMDVCFNLFIATVLMVDLPQELMFTKRLDRYEAEENGGWRHTFALWFCRYWLNPFQIGGHCTK